MNDWITSLRPECGPFVDPARAFVDRWIGDCPDGADGVRRLSEVVRRYLSDETNENDDARFVDEAGAFLALLLVRHVGSGAHVREGDKHWIRLGARGVFDPFGAMSAVLDSPAPLKVLRDAIAHAEAEARDAGPTSRVMLAIEREVERERSDLRVSARGAQSVVFESHATYGDDRGTLEVDLRQAIERTSQLDLGEVEREARSLVSLFPGAAIPDSEETNAFARMRSTIFPRIVAGDFESKLPDGTPRILSIRSRRLAFFGDLRVTFQARTESRARYLSERELTHALEGASISEVVDAALDNLAKTRANARLESFGEHQVLIFRSADSLDAARVLLPGLPEVAREVFAGPWLVALPHRDILAVAPYHPELVLPFEAYAQDLFERAPHGISPHIVLMDDLGELRALDRAVDYR